MDKHMETKRLLSPCDYNKQTNQQRRKDYSRHATITNKKQTNQRRRKAYSRRATIKKTKGPDWVGAYKYISSFKTINKTVILYDRLLHVLKIKVLKHSSVYNLLSYMTAKIYNLFTMIQGKVCTRSVYTPQAFFSSVFRLIHCHMFVYLLITYFHR